MDYFEAIVKTLLEDDGFWTRQSFKINVSKEEKRRIGKPTIPRPEIDLIAYKPVNNEILAVEVKSFIDSSGVRLSCLQEEYDIPEGKYKLFTCKNYRDIVFNRLNHDLIQSGLISFPMKIRLGLAAGNVYRNAEDDIRKYLNENDIFFWGPSDIKERIRRLAKKGYENDPTVIAAKLLV